MRQESQVTNKIEADKTKTAVEMIRVKLSDRHSAKI